MAVSLSENTIEQVIQEMTLREKAKLITGGLPYGTKAIERLGIPAALFNDSMAGINFRQLFANYVSMETGEGILESLRRCEKILQQLRTHHRIIPEELGEYELVAYEAIKKHLNGDLKRISEVTCFPPGILVGATWNPEFVEAFANTLAKEFVAFGDDVLLTPNVNIQRDPLGGRLFESYSEDPYLTGEMGSAFVRGVQRTGLLAEPKHFAANNHEKERKGINVHVSERALREIYFPGFEACVKKGRAATFMSAYNQLNGEACSANHRLLTEILREEWGFDGVVVSDWGGVYDSSASVAAGNDIEMPQNPDIPGLIRDVENGVLPITALDESVRRILKMLVKTPGMTLDGLPDFDAEESQKAAYNAVAEGTVLLKNEGVLPIPQGSCICLAGDGAENLLESGAGSAEVLTRKSKSLLSCMEEVFGRESVCREDSLTESAEYVIIVGRSRGQEGVDRAEMLLDGEDQSFVTMTLRKAKEAGKKTILVLNVAGPVDMREYADYADGIVCVFIPGAMGSRALTDILAGKINPSGKLAITFPDKYLDCPTYGNFPGYNREVWYGEGIYVGYRYYVTKQMKTRYPFGYGLSYTTFEVGQITVPGERFREETVRCSVPVRNTGDMEGKEVVQLYVRHLNPSLQKPDRELKRFCKVSLAPGEEKQITFALEYEDFASYDEKLKKFVTEPGIYELMIGISSEDIRSSVRIALEGFDAYGYNPTTRIATIWADPRCRAIYNDLWADIYGDHMYNDLLGYTPDYPVGKAIAERIPTEAYENEAAREKAIDEFFDRIGRIDLGKTVL